MKHHYKSNVISVVGIGTPHNLTLLTCMCVIDVVRTTGCFTKVNLKVKMDYLQLEQGRMVHKMKTR
jgi:hypothetical protein